MDLRKWLLLNDLPHSSWLEETIHHIPCSDFRTANILRLFATGYHTGFRLTDPQGQPTEALHVMARLMEGVELCRVHGLTPEEQKAFSPGDGTLAAIFDDRWFLRGLTDRVKVANSAIGYDRRDWVWCFLPGLASKYIRYVDPDGKRRKRICYVASCPPNWEMTDSVYEGLWRWNREHVADVGAYFSRSAKRPDGYGVLDLLGKNPTLGSASGQGEVERHPQAVGATA